MYKKKVRDIKKNFLKWRLRNIPERKFVIILSVVVGVLSGLAAVILKNLVHDTYLLITNAKWSNFIEGNILMLIYPSIGILLTVLFLKYFVKGNIGHGIPHILYSISRKKGKIPFHNTYSSLIASTFTVAFGGSVGLEAPIATTGSAIGSNIGRFFHLNTKSVVLLLGCGAAGAIAGIFKAPIAGILFVLEVLMFDLTMTAAIPLLISSITASVIAYFFLGNDVQ
ncbi:MAG: chloride channel protein, partial [Bacteroidales bacterium]|nr:chloride channel protein [Bacteroidales bacterium]